MYGIVAGDCIITRQNASIACGQEFYKLSLFLALTIIIGRQKILSQNIIDEHKKKDYNLFAIS